MCQVICQLIVCSQTAQKLHSQKCIFCAFLQNASKCKKTVDKAKKPWYNYSVRGKKPTAKKIKNREENTMKNANFKKTELVQTYGTTTYGIENYEGMTEQEIINACDPCNFGGVVHGNICKVYID